jgi:hypothetical protein
MSDPVKVAASTPMRVSATPVRMSMLARKCACSGSDSSCARCSDEEKHGGALQRKASSQASNLTRPGRIPDIVRSVLSSPGRPLDPGTRATMESRFGHDFSAVRIHTGADAATSASAVGAHAYTVGNDIVFASHHDLQSPRGMRLLAHELTHTIQQRGVPRASFDSLPVSAPDHSSEHEADAVANAVMSGAVHAPAVAHHGLALLSRQVEGEPDPPNAAETLKLNSIALATLLPLGPDEERIRWFNITAPFPVPAEKGPRALPFWKGHADESPVSKTALHMIVTAQGKLKPVLKAERSGTDTLREMWMTSVGWTKANATSNWNEAGGTAKDFFDRSLAPHAADPEEEKPDAIPQPDAPVAAAPAASAPASNAKTEDKACQFDHVVELQAGGPDAPSNLAVLGGKNNRASAVKITAEIRKRVEQIRAVFPKLEQVGLIYSTVTQPPATCGADICCTIEEKARAPQKAPAEPEVGADEQKYPLVAGNFQQIAVVPKDVKTAEVQLHESTTHQTNDFAARLVPGLILKTLKKPHAKPEIVAVVDPKSAQLITFKDTKGVTLKVGTGGKIDVDKSKPNLGFTFPYLSEGVMTKFQVAPDGLHASGTITPSLPLLKGTLLDFLLTPTSISAALKPKTPLKSPIPGLELTEPQLLLPLFPYFKPEGTVKFAIRKNLVTGVLSVTFDGTSLVATADAVAHIPGLDDDATGKVRYHAKDGFSSEIHLRKSGKQFVKNVAVDVFITDKEGINAVGTIDVEPPGGSLVKLTIARNDDGELQYTGHGIINVPGLANPVDVVLGYSAAGLTAKGTALFELKALKAKGTLGVSYDQNLGFVGTISNFTFKRGLATVTLEKLTLAKQKFTGSGSIEMPVGKALMARGAVTLDEKENLAITAALKIAKPIVLFKAFGGDYDLFRLPAIKIPIPGASIAGIGLKLEILGGLSAGYSVGPGTLEEAEVSAGVNPLQAATTAGVKLKARLLIPARASITGSITGLIAIDAWVAEVAGGVTVSATAALVGGLDARTEVAYSPERLIIDAQLDAALKLMLTLGLDAVVRASLLGAKYEKIWKLGRWPFDPGVTLGIGGDFHYKSDEEFKPPTLRFNKPALDGQKFVTGPFSGTSGQEKKT